MKIYNIHKKHYSLIIFFLTSLITFGQLGDEPQRSQQIDPHYKAAVRVHNPNNTVLKYKYRWGNGEWQSTDINPFQTLVHSYNYYRGNYSSPAFIIRYDGITGDGKFTPSVIELERSKIRKSETSKAQMYYFRFVGNKLLINKFNGYDVNWVGAVKIENRTTNPISYQWKWQGSQTWNTVTLKPGWSRWFSKPYFPGIYNSPAYKIRFDIILGDRKTTWKYHDLERNKSAKMQVKDTAKLYFFKAHRASQIGLYKSTK